MSRMKGLPAKKEEEFYQGILLSAADIHWIIFFPSWFVNIPIKRSAEAEGPCSFFLSLLICRREPTYK